MSDFNIKYSVSLDGVTTVTKISALKLVMILTGCSLFVAHEHTRGLHPPSGDDILRISNAIIKAKQEHAERIANGELHWRPS